jgi:Domain of unknown function (DUF6891)
MEPRTLQQTIEEMRGYIQRKTAAGFDPPEDIPACAVEAFSDEQAAEVLRPIAQQLTSEAVEAQLAAQERWPAVTDCDLLDRALEELERAGVVSRQDFTCCRT